MRVRWSALAVADLVEIRAYVGTRNRLAARRLAQRIRKEVGNLSKHPALGRAGRVPGTRELVLAGTPFILPYRVREDVLEILRVLHASRRWPRRF